MEFENRREAGRVLAALAASLAPERPAVVAMLPGGVAVGAEIARALDAPLAVVAVRELSTTWQSEIAIAVADDHPASVIAGADHGAPLGMLEPLIDVEVDEAIAQARRFRGAGAPLAVGGRTALLVDDGMRSSGAVIAAARLLRRAGARRVVFAAPFLPLVAPRALHDEVDAVLGPEATSATERREGNWYWNPDGTSDAEIAALLSIAVDAAAGMLRPGS